MGFKVDLKKIITNLLFMFTVLTISTNAFAQKSPHEFKHFEIVVEKSKTDIKLHSVTGIEWSNLTMSMSDGQTETIGVNGILSQKDIEKMENNETNSYIISITRTSDGVAMKGVKGTEWLELGFSMDSTRSQAINENGMTTNS